MNVLNVKQLCIIPISKDISDPPCPNTTNEKIIIDREKYEIPTIKVETEDKTVHVIDGKTGETIARGGKKGKGESYEDMHNDPNNPFTLKKDGGISTIKDTRDE